MRTETNPRPATEATQAFDEMMRMTRFGTRTLGHTTLITPFFVYGIVATKIGEPLRGLGATPEKVLEIIGKMTFRRSDYYRGSLTNSPDVKQLILLCVRLDLFSRTSIRVAYLIDTLFTQPDPVTVLRKLRIERYQIEDEKVLERIKKIEVDMIRPSSL